jgi:excisionase family DNA binding protein
MKSRGRQQCFCGFDKELIVEPERLAEMASASKLDREWLSLRQLTEYASVSERTLREWLHRQTDALPAVRVDGKILVRRSQFDAWLEHHRIQPGALVDVDAIVNGLVRDAG